VDDFWVSAENSRNSRVRCERLGCCMLCPPGAGDWHGSTSPGLTEGVWGPERRSGGSRSSRQSHPGSLQKTAETAESAARGSFRRVFWLLSACDRLEGASLTFWGTARGMGAQRGSLDGPGGSGEGFLGFCRNSRKQQSALQKSGIPSRVLPGACSCLDLCSRARGDTPGPLVMASAAKGG
jgi:hypothetical protein